VNKTAVFLMFLHLFYTTVILGISASNSEIITDRHQFPGQPP